MLEEKGRPGKHLSLEERHKIQRGLREHRSFSEIAMGIGCSADTVSREIRKHRYHKKKEKTYLSSRITPNNCKYRYTCRRKDVCRKPRRHKCTIPCRECLRCNSLCPDFVYAPCPVKEKPPYVCNNCRRSASCLFEKYLYNADYAHREYEETLKRSREGINLTRDELFELDALVSPLILKGQPLCHIYSHHGNEIPCKLRTLYNYVENGYLTAKKMDLRRAVRYKKRSPKREAKTSNKKKEGRRYEDFLQLLSENGGQRVVEMDTVEGVKGGKVLQTFIWRENGLMLAYLQEKQTMQCMAETLDQLEERLGLETFRELFPVTLTDNGKEFEDPDLFEANQSGEHRTNIYYCEARSPNQKGSLEKNHEYIRYVVPKGKPFDGCTQEEILNMVNHINNTARPRFDGKAPIDLAMEAFGEETVKKLGLTKMNPDEVHLMPDLIK